MKFGRAPTTLIIRSIALVQSAENSGRKSTVGWSVSTSAALETRKRREPHRLPASRISWTWFYLSIGGRDV
jgi:hypothetical protein